MVNCASKLSTEIDSEIKYLYLIMKKSTAISTLNELPKEFSLDDFFEKFLVIEKIDDGLKDVKEGKTISHEKMKKEIKKWLK